MIICTLLLYIGIESGAVSKLEGPRGPEHFLARRALDTTEVLSVNVRSKRNRTASQLHPMSI